MAILEHLGKYILFMGRVFSKPERFRVYYKQIIREIENLGISSIGIVTVISLFIGAVITIQTAYNMENPFLPTYLIGLMARDTILLEFSSTIIALILAGKAGSSISSEIGTMQVTEQIDALEIMGVNSACFLVLPKIAAALFFFPLLCVMSMIVGIFGGWSLGSLSGVVSSEHFISGIRYALNLYYVWYAIVKMLVYALIVTTIPAYFGYHVTGGSLEVGNASTTSVVWSSILILVADLILTQLMLS
ncbi:MAG: MlaE family ABC transporter permease [Bacteroidales bacterium]